MNNRLQVNGLALVVKSKYEENVGRVVLLLEDVGFRVSPHTGKSHYYWRVQHSDCTAIGKNIFGNEFKTDVVLAAEESLLPLGDQKSVEMFELEKEHEFN